MNSKAAFSAILLGSLLSTAQAQTTTPATTSTVTMTSNATLARGPVLLNASEIANLRAHPERFADVLKGCANKLNDQPRPLASLNPGNHYDSAGVTAKTAESQNLSNDATTSYRLALCYLVTQKSDYAAASQRILDAWATTLKQATTPQGKDNVNFNLPYMIVAASWVRGANGWDSSKFDTFLRQTVLPLSLASNPNNHGLWAMLMEASAGAYLGDAQILTQARTRWQAIIMGAIKPNGQMPREMTRSDTSDYHSGKTMGIKGIAYTHYSLLPASMTAKIFADVGQPIWNTPAGQRLGKAYAQAAAWTLHPETFPYYQRNGGKLMDVNNAAYFPLLQEFYPNKDAQTYLEKQQGGQVSFVPLIHGVPTPLTGTNVDRNKIGMNGFYLLQLFGR